MTVDPAQGPEPDPRAQRTRLLIAIAVIVLIVAVLVAVGVALAQRRTGSDSDPDASGTPSGSPTRIAGPTATAVPKPTRQPTATSVPIDSGAQPVADGLEASIAKLEAVKGEAKGPGDVAGPAVRVTVAIANPGKRSVDLSGVTVTADYGKDRTPALQLDEPGGSPFPSSVKAGATVQGVFVFTIPVDARSTVRITVDTSVDRAPVVFSGSAPVS